MQPLVSVVMPTKNRSDMVSRAIASVLNQTYANVEVIVVDDGSSDNTADIIREIEDKRVQYVGLEKSSGACVARNIGISRAQGEFLTFLDDDDEFLPSRISNMLKAWDPRWAYICSGYYYVGRKGKTREFLPKPIITLNDLLYRITIGNTVLTLTSRIRELGGFDESLKSSQDYDLWVRLSFRYGLAKCVQEPLFVIHTEHDKPRITMSKNKVKGHFDFYRKHKSIMNKEQRKSKLYEILRYRNKRISIKNLIWLGRSKSSIDNVKYYVKSRSILERLKLFGVRDGS